jgi:ubiquinol-cytochrome c reductase subunit 6
MAEKEQVVDEIVEEESEEGTEEEEEEDLVDPKEEVTEQCSEVPKCAKLREIMDECTERVNSKSQTTETCTEELIDFMHCVDTCVIQPHLSLIHVRCMRQRICSRSWSRCTSLAVLPLNHTLNCTLFLFHIVAIEVLVP